MEPELAFLKRLKGGIQISINSLPFVVGRCKTANFVIGHVNVSRNHCEITRENHFWKIVDSSSSGTFVNDKLIGKGNSRVLNNGDVVRFGPVESDLLWTFFVINCVPSAAGSERNDLGVITEADPVTEDNSTIPARGENFGSPFGLNSTVENKQVTEKALSMTKIELPPDMNKTNYFKVENVLIDNKSQNFSTISGNARENSSAEVTASVDENPCEELENQLIKKEEEKKRLLKKLMELEETQKTLLQKLNVNSNDSNCVTNEKKLGDNLNLFEKEIGISCSENKFIKTQGLLKESELVKDASNGLENENCTLEEELAATKCKIEASLSKNNFLENLADLIETEFQCTICSELFVTAVTLGCTHTFCKHCISQWKKKQKTCPICRKKITSETRALVIDNYIDKVVENLGSNIKNHRERVIEERKEVIPSKKSRTVKYK